MKKIEFSEEQLGAFGYPVPSISIVSQLSGKYKKYVPKNTKNVSSSEVRQEAFKTAFSKK